MPCGLAALRWQMLLLQSGKRNVCWCFGEFFIFKDKILSCCYTVEKNYIFLIFSETLWDDWFTIPKSGFPCHNRWCWHAKVPGKFYAKYRSACFSFCSGYTLQTYITDKFEQCWVVVRSLTCLCLPWGPIVELVFRTPRLS